MSTPTGTDAAPESERFEIDWVRAIGGALAAVASAFLLSTLGAAGTIIGAAIGSLVVTVSSAYFSKGIDRSRRSLTTQAQAREQVGIAQAEVQRAGRTDDAAVQESHLEYAEEKLAEANDQLDRAVADSAPSSWTTRMRALPWKRITWVTIALFVVAILLITVFELVAGRTVSSITGGSDNEGTTISNVGGSGSGKRDAPKDDPSEEPAEDEESVEPSPTETTATPSESATPSETAEPSPTPTETSSPSPAATEESAE